MKDAASPRRAWIAALLLAFAGGLVAGLPLALALRLAGVGALAAQLAPEGSVLHWTARTPDGAQLRFDAELAALLTGRYGGRLRVVRGDATLEARALRDWDGTLRLADGRLDAGLAPLTEVIGLPPSMLEGRLVLEGVALSWRDGALRGLACHGAVGGVRVVGAGAPLALGDLGVECVDDPVGPRVTVADRGGPLAFAAELRFTPDGRFLLEGEATARPTAPPALADALPLLGRSRGPGQVGFRYAGELAAPPR